MHAGIGLSAYRLAGPLGQHWYFFIYLHLKSTTCLQYCLHSELITETCSVFVQFFRIVLFGVFLSCLFLRPDSFHQFHQLKSLIKVSNQSASQEEHAAGGFS